MPFVASRHHADNGYRKVPVQAPGWVCGGGGMRHSCVVGMNSRVVVLAVLSVVLAGGLGFEAGLRAGPLAGVLSALAGFVPAVVWELTRDRRERAAGGAEERGGAPGGFRSEERRVGEEG